MGVRVGPAGGADIGRIVAMVEQLRLAVRGPVAVDAAWTGAMVARLIASPDGFVWVSAQGFLAGSLGQTMISPVWIAQEHGWFATDGQGLRLLRAFEGWAQGKGAALVQLSTGACGVDLGRLGYRMAEQAWVREVGG